MSDGRRDDTEGLLAGVDAPRPLPRDLRDRLEQQLLSASGDTAPIALGAELEERLEATLTDPVAGQLRGIDAPRMLPPELRDRLEQQLTRRAAPRRAPSAFVGAAAAVVLFAALVVAVARPGGSSHESGSSAAPSSARADGSTTNSVGESTGGSVGTTGGGVAVGLGSPASPGPVQAPKSAQDSTADKSASGSAGGASYSTDALSGVSPNAGPLRGGTTVTVHGSGFADSVAVMFGGRAASFRVASSSSLTAVSPAVAAPGTVDIAVRLRDGSMLVSHNAFSYLAPPRIDAVSPSTGTTNGGTWVAVTGAALRRTTGVVFGEVKAAQFRVVSDTELRALSPQHLPGPVDIRVTTPGGRSATSSGDRYTYLP